MGRNHEIEIMNSIIFEKNNISDINIYIYIHLKNIYIYIYTSDKYIYIHLINIYILLPDKKFIMPWPNGAASSFWEQGLP